ncbi:MAG TPA: ABC-F family ATP-binding cassette domain-containing protein [Gemmatimonadales bacterium]|nr:ABC-F family ATP-binding cassette domain-containing protein [Gemmatimonadales bacterium]
MSVLSLSAVAVEYGGEPLFRDLTLAVEAGERWAIVGRNGAGKTTLFRLITGETEPTRGTVARASGLRMALLDQYRDFGSATTVWEAAAGPFAELLALESALHAEAAQLGESATDADLQRYAEMLERFEREGGYTVAPRVDAVLHGLGFDPEGARTQELSGLSGGERGRLGLARQLVAPAELLLLDEPTNHLDLETTRWLEDYLKGYAGTLLLISHDRAFMAAVVDHVLHLEHGSGTSYAGGYEAFVTQRAERRLAAERAFAKQQKNIASEEDYIRRNIAGGNSRQAKGRRRRLARLPRLSAPEGDDGVMSVRFESAARGGDQVLVAENVGLEIEDRTLLRDFTARITRGEVVGLIGANGTGKSTLLRALFGEREVNGGNIRLGDSVTAAYYRQDLAQVSEDQRLYDMIADRRPMWSRGAVQGHLGRFGFSGDSVQRRAGSLSGGERARMALALMMLTGANFLVFDEPTNHLDVESIEALEDAIAQYDGTVLLVSHDRALLSALVTRLWILHDQRITDFPGGFDEWEAASSERAEAARIAAAEEEPARRVRERQTVRRGNNDSQRERQTALRRAQRELEESEAQVAIAEAAVAELVRRLEDPALYADADGAREAARLSAELKAARGTLDRAYEQWAAATAAVESAAALAAVSTPR